MTPRQARRVHYELRAVDGPRLTTLLAFRTMKNVMEAAPDADERVLSIWAVPEDEAEARLVAVRNRGASEWTLIEEPRE
jgi:hypothetical protein